MPPYGNHSILQYHGMLPYHHATECHNVKVCHLCYYNTSCRRNAACHGMPGYHQATMPRHATGHTSKSLLIPPAPAGQAWAHGSLLQPSCQHSPSQTSNLHLSNLKLASFNPKTCISSSLSLPLKMSLASTPPHLLPGNWTLYLADLISGVSCHTLCL